MSYLLGRTGFRIARNGFDGSANLSGLLSWSHYRSVCVRDVPAGSYIRERTRQTYQEQKMTNQRTGNSINKINKSYFVLAAIIGVLCLAPTAAMAEMIQIQVGGVDFGYDGANVMDMDTSDPDSLTNATFLVDNALLGIDVLAAR
jgi:hypothetical protein